MLSELHDGDAEFLVLLVLFCNWYVFLVCKLCNGYRSIVVVCFYLERTHTKNHGSNTNCKNKNKTEVWGIVAWPNPTPLGSTNRGWVIEKQKLWKSSPSSPLFHLVVSTSTFCKKGRHWQVGPTYEGKSRGCALPASSWSSKKKWSALHIGFVDLKFDDYARIALKLVCSRDSVARMVQCHF